MGRVFAAVIFVFFITLAGCGINSDSPAICKKEIKSYAGEAEVTRKMTIYVYHKDGYVTKTVCVEENELINGSVADLVVYEQSVKETFSSETFQVDGYSYSTELKGTIFTLTTTNDYTKTNIEEDLKNGKEFYHVKGLFDENDRIPYDELIKKYAELGFSCKEEL